MGVWELDLNLIHQAIDNVSSVLFNARTCNQLNVKKGISPICTNELRRNSLEIIQQLLQAFLAPVGSVKGSVANAAAQVKRIGEICQAEAGVDIRQAIYGCMKSSDGRAE